MLGCPVLCCACYSLRPARGFGDACMRTPESPVLPWVSLFMADRLAKHGKRAFKKLGDDDPVAGQPVPTPAVANGDADATEQRTSNYWEGGEAVARLVIAPAVLLLCGLAIYIYNILAEGSSVSAPRAAHPTVPMPHSPPPKLPPPSPWLQPRASSLPPPPQTPPPPPSAPPSAPPIPEPPPPPFAPPALVRNARGECYDACGGRGGACAAFCGGDGACCRAGYDGGSAACAFGTAGCTANHCCVRLTHVPPPSPPSSPRPPRPPPSPPSPSPAPLAPSPLPHSNDECYEQCDQRGGRQCASYCGERQACCRQTYDDDRWECGFGSRGCGAFHCCTALPPAPPPAPPAPPSPSPSPPQPPWAPSGALALNERFRAGGPSSDLGQVGVIIHQ